eukprot:scaffold75792_cov65-Phaeocystis_antarctica.AAC.5
MCVTPLGRPSPEACTLTPPSACAAARSASASPRATAGHSASASPVGAATRLACLTGRAASATAPAATPAAAPAVDRACLLRPSPSAAAQLSSSAAPASSLQRRHASKSQGSQL